jgi:hypothetical protein
MMRATNKVDYDFRYSSSGLWWTKWRWGRFSPSTSVSPANLYSPNFSTITITYHQGLVQSASSGRSTQSPTVQIKKTNYYRQITSACYLEG